MTRVVHWCEAAVTALAPWDAVFAGWLDGAERDRAARFAFERDAGRYRRAHGLLRGLLAAATGVAPTALAFAAPVPGGKPALVPPSRWRFNLSHAEDRVLVAWSDGVEVGADVERVRSGIAAEGIGERFFAPDEAAFVGVAPDRDAAFTTVWARKEALLKARGEGLAGDLRAFSVVAAPAIRAPGDARCWWWQDLPVEGPYRAAIAGDGEPAPLLRRDWPPAP